MKVLTTWSAPSKNCRRFKRQILSKMVTKSQHRWAFLIIKTMPIRERLGKKINQDQRNWFIKLTKQQKTIIKIKIKKEQSTLLEALYPQHNLRENKWRKKMSKSKVSLTFADSSNFHSSDAFQKMRLLGKLKFLRNLNCNKNKVGCNNQLPLRRLIWISNRKTHWWASSKLSVPLSLGIKTKWWIKQQTQRNAM